MLKEETTGKKVKGKKSKKKQAEAPKQSLDGQATVKRPNFRSFHFFNVSPDNLGGGRCTPLLTRQKNGQFLLDEDVAIGNLRCFPGKGLQPPGLPGDRMICNKVWVMHPDGATKDIGMLLFK